MSKHILLSVTEQEEGNDNKLGGHALEKFKGKRLVNKKRGSGWF